MQYSYGSPFASHILNIIYWRILILILIFDGVTVTVKPCNLLSYKKPLKWHCSMRIRAISSCFLYFCHKHCALVIDDLIIIDILKMFIV